MPSTRNNLSVRKDDSADKLTYRSAAVRLDAAGGPTTYDPETRSVEVVAATEQAVDVFDWERMEVVSEVLLMSGVEVPKNRQIVLLDAHSRWSSSSVLGSARGLRVEGDQLVARAHFSTVPEAEAPHVKVREGHITDFSAGYRVIDSVWVPRGEKQTIRGRSFEGPVKVATRWRIKELSVVPIGADDQATARGERVPGRAATGESEMDEKLRKRLEALGLREDATEQEAWAFLDSLRAPEPEGDAGGNAPDPAEVERIRAEATDSERNRIREIDAVCQRFDCADLAGRFIVDGTGIDAVYRAVAEHQNARMQQLQVGHRPARIEADERDKFRAAAQDALCLRSSMRIETPAQGALDLRGYRLVEIARMALRMANQPDRGRPLEMVGRALTVSDLPYILANVANKALAEGYESAPETWRVWCSTGQVSDFKTHYMPRLSEFSDLDEVAENAEYRYGELSEEQESYSIATYGKLFAISRQTIINDDLNALTGMPMSMGEAAARKIGDLPYAVLTGNAAMGDGTALFATGHSNYVASGSGAAPGISTIAACLLAMGKQKGPGNLRYLNIRPEYIIMPKALEGAAEIFFRSERFSDHSTVATDSTFASTRVNPYAGDYFTRVYDARLDAADAAQWYAAGDKRHTVKVFFLDGQESPYLESKEGWSVDGIEYKVRIDAGAKALDWRYLYFNDGN